jgi:NADP-dependent 3-hydroxy acid dehydrogenase YdfG
MSNRRQILTGLGAAGIAAGTIYTKSVANADDKKPVTPQPTSVNPQARFANKVVLITGATSGIGKETAKAFAQQGAKVFFCGRRENLGKQVEQQIRDAGGEATYMKADVRKAEEVKAFVDGCVAKYGGLDIAFNNAGVDYPPQAIADTKI